LPERAVQRGLDHAQELTRRGHPQRARSVLERIVERAPTEPRPVLRLAELRLPQQPSPSLARPSAALQNEAAQVRTMLDRCLQGLEPDRAGARRKLRRARAWTFAVEGDHREGIETVGRAMGKLDRQSARTLTRIAAVAVRRHDLQAAGHALQLARRADPRQSELLADQGAIKLARGRADEAVALFRRALERKPDHRALRRDLAGALLARGDADSAVSIFATLAKQCPQSPRCHLDVARAALQAGAGERAEAAARRAIRHASASDPEPHVLLGLALASQERREEAAEAFRGALARDPDHARAKRSLESLQKPRMHKGTSASADSSHDGPDSSTLGAQETGRRLSAP
jgi:tetratricopeptide (TPR) repeat protein